MTITYPLTLPASPAFTKVQFTMDNAAAVGESPFTFEQQVYLNQGQRFRASFTLPVMKRIKSAAWVAAMASLNGRYGTFLAGDPDAANPQGIATGTPIVNGASQVGRILLTKGWSHSITGILKAGDYIQLGSGATARMHMITKDANSDGSGNSSLDIWPLLRYSPSDAATIVIRNCVTNWRLDAAFGWSTDELSVYSVTFSATEAL